MTFSMSCFARNLILSVRILWSLGLVASGPVLLPGMLFCVLLCSGAPGWADGGAVIRYESDIRPMFDKHCTSCHSGWFPDARLDLSSLEGVRKGGKSGPLVVAGKPDKGWLMYVLTRASGRQQMPPEGERLSAMQIQQIRDWILAGAR